MTFTNPHARLFIPDEKPDALARITHLGVGAHQDDLEFMAYHGILACYDSETEWFGGVTCTDGAGSARQGEFAEVTDEELRGLRVREQETAAIIGRFGVMIQLGYESRTVRDPADGRLQDDLKEIIRQTRPGVIYTHNPTDKHDTHIGVMVALLQALRELPAEFHPQAVYGCEAWRGLDWMLDEDKTVHDVSDRESLTEALNGVFKSQIAGGKRYDLATLGRRRANATFLHPRLADRMQMASFAMDLTPLLRDPSLSIVDYALGFVRRLESDVRDRLSRRFGKE